MKKTKNNKSKKKSNPRTRKADPKARPKPKPKGAKKPEQETMDRPTLISITRLLQGAGSDVKALKSDADAMLQKKVNDAIQRLPPPEVIKLLESVDPGKLVSALKLDCLGIFIDLTDVSCVRCPDAKSCAGKFIENMKSGFAHLRGAVADGKDDRGAGPAKQAIAPVTRYEADRLVFVRDAKNPNPKGNELHDTIQRVLDEQPETLGELRAIVEDDFDLDGDGDFMKFVTTLRDPKEGVIKLDVDLTDTDKAALRKAGYEI